jgi:cytochrome c553
MAGRRILPGWWSWKTTAALAVVAVLLAAPAALLVAYSGVYSVAASEGHPKWMNWFLSVGMRRSVQANARPAPHPDLSDPGLIALGAAHFQGGCAPCHAAPGQQINAVFGGMLPQPPRLEDKVARWKDHELHWIVYHGLQYAGMPGWSGEGRQDEVWALVAFLRQLPDMDVAAYEAIALRNDPRRDLDAIEVVATGAASGQLASCGRCHEAPTHGPISRQTPNLGGLSASYIAQTLRDYRDGRRQSGVMEPVATQLSDTDIERVSAHYAQLQPERRPAPVRDAEAVRRGGQIAESGLPGQRISACNACHGLDADAAYPRLDGQPAEYIEAQLNLYRNNRRDTGALARMMTDIAIHLNASEAHDVSVYYESLSP